ncbi:RluA family pseudouridine synthase [Alkalibaculum sp. M08DMB]|uniref:Pseudouridine synthase n=1 Tax=Alkalibaculum sporogenes TaxID=2655001 RepID=A0A6A7KBR3_9FIRM|nr:RluA family pseudouridine synthase [Alkalibaculum sporogenes]MPW26627.1 RluA family pseudouridine synthase [Alkalibaculum sporogenes]
MRKYQENYFTYIYNVDGQTFDTKVKDYLMDKFHYSSRLIRKIKREGEILVNDIKVTINEPLKANDKIVVYLGEEHIDSDPEDIPIKVIHEDDDVLVINKNPGIVTHATRSHPRGTLANAIAFYWEKNNINAKIRFVNRLDRDTSGVIIIAKNKYAHQFIQNEMKQDKVEKIYCALVEGIPDVEEGTIHAPIGRPYEDSIMRIVMEEGKEAITHYKTIKKFKEHSLLEIRLETGRTHQIRVHLKSIGHPIIGDSLYNENSMQYISRQALHANKIVFNHSRLHIPCEFKADMPRDIEEVINKLEL